MNKKLETELRNKIRPIVERLMTEENNSLDSQDLKVALRLINGLSDGSVGLRHSTNDRGLLDFERKVSALRIEIMEYVEQNSQYTFYGKSPHGFKLVKKGK